MREDIKVNERVLAIEDKLIDKFEQIFDPEVELDIYNLGLLYEVTIDEEKNCNIVMTFTDTACECSETLPIELVESLKELEEIDNVTVQVTWSPAWKITRISRYGRIALGISPK